MRHLNIRSCAKAKKRMKTGRTAYLAPNLMARNFEAKALNEKWVTDVTEFRVGNEKLYLSPMMDLEKAIQSMSRKGNWYDTVIERFFSIVKSECFYPNRFVNIVEL